MAYDNEDVELYFDDFDTKLDKRSEERRVGKECM